MIYDKLNSPKHGAGGGRGRELLLHPLGGTEGGVDLGLERGGGLRFGGLVGGRHFVPEEGVVVVASTAVADSGAGGEGVGLEGNDVDGGLARAKRVALELRRREAKRLVLTFPSVALFTLVT